MPTRRSTALVAAVTCATTLLAASAGAAVFLRVDPGGSVLPADSLVRNLGTGHVTRLRVGGIECFSSTFTATVGASGGATVIGTVKSWTFHNCIDTVPGLAVTSCSQAPTTTANVAFLLTELYVDQLWLKCGGDPSGSSCYYKAQGATGGYQPASITLNVYFPPLLGGPGTTITHSVPTGVTDDTGVACGTDGVLETAITRLVSGTPNTVLTVTAS